MKRFRQALKHIKAFFGNMFKKDIPPEQPKAELKEFPLWKFPVRSGKVALGWADGQIDPATGLAGSIKGIDAKFRSTHFYAVGASGSGKSKFLESLAIQDIIQDEGFGVIDPHGDLVEDIKGWIYFWSQKDFKKDIVLIDPSDPKIRPVLIRLSRLMAYRRSGWPGNWWKYSKRYGRTLGAKEWPILCAIL